MAEIQLQGLQPGQQCFVQVRTKAKGDPNKVSEWSSVFRFNVTNDLIAPKPVTNLTLVSEGSAFIAKWNAPTQNANGTNCTDLDGYYLVFKNTDNLSEVTREVYSSARSFTLDFETNKEMFGTARGNLTVEVKAVDRVGNRSTATTASASNPRPADVTGLVVTAAIEAVAMSWDKNTTDIDLVGYEVHSSTLSAGFTPGPSTLRWSGTGTGYTLPTSNPVPHHVKVFAVDIFGLTSQNAAYGVATPRTTTSTDGTPPGAPTAVTITSAADGKNAAIKLGWTPPIDADLDHYDIRYSLDNVDWSYLTVPAGTNEARLPSLLANTPYYVGIRAVDFSANRSGWTNAPTYPFTTVPDTTPIPTPAAPVAMSGVSKVLVAHTLEDSTGTFMTGLDRLEIHMQNDDSTPAPGPFSRLAEITVVGATFGVSTLVSLVTEPDTDYYWYVVAVGENGMRSAASAITLATPGLIEGAYIADATIDDAKINNLSANKLQANTAFINDLFIRSKLTIDDVTGQIVSSDYNAGTVTGWKIDKSGIIVNDGSIKAKALEIQSSPNICPPQYSGFEFNKQMYSDSSDNANTTYITTSSALMKLTMGLDTKYGNQALLVTDSGTAANSTLDLAPSGGWTVDVDALQTYIISAYIKNTSATSRTNRLQVTTNGGQTFQATVTGTSGNGYQRVSVVAALNNTSTKLKVSIVKVDAAATEYLLDGVQIERKIGALNTPSNYNPPGLTSLNGEGIVTGSIRSSAPAIGIPGQPAWSLNTQGNMQVGDALVRGNLVVGAGADTTNSMVKSSNYNVGSAGWMINGAGDVEFNSGIFRGTLGAGTVTTNSLAAGLVLSDRIVAGVANGARVEMMGGTGANAGLVAYSAATTKSMQINTSGVFTSYNTAGQRTIEMDAAGNFRTYNPASQTAVFTLSNTGSIAIANSGGDTFTASAAGDIVVRGTIKTANSGARIEIQPAVGITFYAATTSTSPRNYTRWIHSTFTDLDSVSKAGFTINSPSIQALRFYNGDTRQFYSRMTMASSSTEMWAFRVLEESNNREHSRMMIRAKDIEIVGGPTTNAESTDAAYVQNNWAPMLYMPWGGHAGGGTPGRPIIMLSHLRNDPASAPLHRSGFQASVDPNITAVIYSNNGLILRDFTNSYYTTFTAGDINGGIIKYNQLVQNTSGVQFKENFEKLPEMGLDVLRNAPISRWNYKDKPDEARIGPIATDLPDWLTVASTQLHEEEEDAGDYTKTKVLATKQANSSYELTSIIGVMWQAIRELDEELDAYRTELGRELPKRRHTHKAAKAKETWVENIAEQTNKIDTEESK
ncbi:minor tail protein [Rhodococcus phage Trina]|uniref:Minor tail protein n=1 Tax=Rhodococcus phage Trina TaxID=2027905 RepID=A0A2D1A6L2_9CAUD|nr:minor tail protein [Rhodococcus phage Trina]ASZ74900.1 minor tail protein [Rhodococcus phage Trina]